MKKAFARILAVLMLLSCCLTAASAAGETSMNAENFDPEGVRWNTYHAYIIMQCRPWLSDTFGVTRGWVRTKETKNGSTKLVRSYDSKGNLLKEADSSGLVTSYAYDKNGNVIKMSAKSKDGYMVIDDLATDAKSRVITYAYDAAGKLKKEVRRTVYLDGYITKETVAYAYDNGGRLKKEVLHTADSYGYTHKKVTAYAYSKTGDLTKKVFVRYDTDNRKVQTDVTVYARTYDTTGMLRKLVRTVTSSDYGQVRRIEKSVWAFDGNGNLTKAVVENEFRMKYTFAYDNAGRLIKAIEADLDDGRSETTTFAYDRNGNLAKSVCVKTDKIGSRESTTLTYAYNSGGTLKKVNEKVTESDGGNDDEEQICYTFSYDKNGNLQKYSVIEMEDGVFDVCATCKYAYKEVKA